MIVHGITRKYLHIYFGTEVLFENAFLGSHPFLKLETSTSSNDQSQVSSEKPTTGINSLHFTYKNVTKLGSVKKILKHLREM